MSVDRPAAERAIADLLASLGDHGFTDHTEYTPARVAKAWAEALSGYDEEPSDHLRTTFPAPEDPGVILVSGIRVESTCAHHLLPITGMATVAYLPEEGDRIVGLSKLVRVVEGYARRLQVQEQITAQVTDAIDGMLSPVAAGCVITAEHGCMTHRGVAQAGTRTTTANWAGSWYSTSGSPDVLAEHRASLAYHR